MRDIEPETTACALDPVVLQRLRNLPDAAAPPFEFSEFSRRRARRRQVEAQRPLRLLAASVAVVLGGWLLRHGLTSSVLGSVAGPVASISVPENPPSDADAPLPPSTDWPVLLPTTEAERWLRQHPRQALVRVPAQMAVTELEDQIATMDDQLNAARLAQPRAQQVALLQRDRAQLVESLAQVRYAQNLVAGTP